MKIIAYIVGGLAVIALFVVLVSWINMPEPPKPEPDGPLVTAARQRISAMKDEQDASRMLGAGIAGQTPCGGDKAKPFPISR